MGSLLMVRPRVLGSLGYALDHKKRTVAVNLDETMQVDDDYTIELPAGYVIDEIPDPVKIDEGFAAYQSWFEVKDNKLHYTRSFTVRQVTLPADRYADVQKLATAISSDESGSAVLEHFHSWSDVLRQCWNQAVALSGVICGSSSVMAWSRASLLLALAERSRVLSFDQAFSMGFRSGE
jgi:hypothetical protein